MRLHRLAVGVGIGLTLAASASASTAVLRSPSRSWPERVVLREPLAIPSQAISGEFVYELVSRTHTPARGPYLLERRNLLTGAVRKGPLFSVGEITVAADELWVFGSIGGRPRLFEVDPQRLTLTRTIALPKAAVSFGSAITAGPGRSIWVGSGGTLRRIDAATANTLAQVKLPSHLAVTDLAVDPSGRYLYVSLASEFKGGLEGASLREYDAHAGQLLARAAAAPPLSYARAGAALTAVPGGVWASFRTGMLGLTIHLRQHDLALQPPPTARVALTPANGLFHWPMFASSLYGGGALWLANDNGVVACLNAATGTVRARERVPAFHEPDLLAVDPTHHHVFGLAGARLVQITPPAGCWR